MTYLVTWTIPAKSNSSLAQEKREFHDSREEAVIRAEQLLKGEAVDVLLWEQVGAPKLVQIVKWENEV